MSLNSLKFLKPVFLTGSSLELNKTRANKTTTNLIMTLGLIFSILMLSSPLLAKTKRANSQTDWAVFVETDPLECWVVSSAKTRVLSPDTVANSRRMNRKDILMMAFLRPSNKDVVQIAFTPGYKMRNGSKIRLNVGEKSYSFFSKGEWAWPSEPKDDRKILAAFQAKTEATITVEGTATSIDTFSLKGFTSALRESEAFCELRSKQ